METAETSIRGLFSIQDRKYKIPSYQRSYSWDTDQIQQFIKDLKEAKKSYYLGHFLFELDPNLHGRMQSWQIIDGQQRLTTCLIFFSAIYIELSRRRQAGDEVMSDLSEIQHFYLRDKLKGTQRLETVKSDNNLFVKTVVDCTEVSLTPETGSQMRMLSALSQFKDAFMTQTTQELERWYELLSEAKCTFYCVKDKITAARIFAFQNDRGKRLSDLEVLKSFFMLQILLHGRDPEEMSEHLQFVENEISTIYQQIVRVMLDEDQVLRYLWQTYPESGGFNSQKPVDEIKAYILDIDPNISICNKIRAFTSDLAEAFRIVESIESGPLSKIPSFIHLRYLDNMAMSYPFLIKAGRAKITELEMDRLAHLLENITFRSLLRNGRAGVEARLNHYLLRPIAKDYIESLLTGIIADLRTNGWWGYWSDTEVEDLLNSSFYGNRVDNYVLWRYELYLCDESGYPPSLKVEYKDLVRQENIEHIAPQTETNMGSVAAGYGEYIDDQQPEKGLQSGNWINRLGNLMLISKRHNCSIGNRPFEEKLASYGSANLLNQQKEIKDLATHQPHPIWDLAAIQRRQAKITTAAKKLWSLEAI